MAKFEVGNKIHQILAFADAGGWGDEVIQPIFDQWLIKHGQGYV